MTQYTQRCLIIFQAYTYTFVKQLICYLSILSQHSIFIQASYYHVRNVFFFDLVYANYTGFYIINIIDCYTLSYYHILFSCSSSFCESGKQPVVEGLTESCTMILEIMFFFSIQVPVSKSLLSSIKLFFVVFCGFSTLVSIPIAVIYF